MERVVLFIVYLLVGVTISIIYFFYFIKRKYNDSSFIFFKYKIKILRCKYVYLYDDNDKEVGFVATEYKREITFLNKIISSEIFINFRKY